MKLNFFKATFFIFFILFLFSNTLCFAQGDPWEDNQTSIFEESDLYIDAYSAKNRSIYQDQPVSAGGYLGIGIISNAPSTSPDPRKLNAPTIPTGPDTSVPIDSEIIYLILAGFIFGIYKIKNKFAF